MVNKTRVKAFAKLVAYGTRSIEDLDQEYIVPVYVELIKVHDWAIDQVDQKYRAEVLAQLG